MRPDIYILHATSRQPPFANTSKSRYVFWRSIYYHESTTLIMIYSPLTPSYFSITEMPVDCYNVAVLPAERRIFCSWGLLFIFLYKMQANHFHFSTLHSGMSVLSRSVSCLTTLSNAKTYSNFFVVCFLRVCSDTPRTADAFRHSYESLNSCYLLAIPAYSINAWSLSEMRVPVAYVRPRLPIRPVRSPDTRTITFLFLNISSLTTVFSARIHFPEI